MSTSQFQQKVRDGESMGIPRDVTFKAIKDKGYSIQGEPQPEQGVISKIYDYAIAPIDAAVGVGIRAVGAGAGLVGAEKLRQAAYATTESQGLRENLLQTADIAPVALGTLGSFAAGPLGTGLGTGIGAAAQHGIRQALGEESTDLSALPRQALDVAGKTIAATALDYGFNKAGKMITGSKPVQAAKNFIGEKFPKRIIESLIKPGLKETKFGKDPAGAILKEGIVSGSLEDLLKQVSSKADEAGQSIEKIVLEKSAKVAPQIDQSPLIADPINRAIKEASKYKRTNATYIQALENLRDDLLESAGKVDTPLGVLGTKRDVQGMIKWDATDPFASQKNKVLWDVFDNLRNALNKNVDGLADANARYSDLIAAKVSLQRRAARVGSSNLLGNMSPLVTGGAAGGAEFARSGEPIQSIKAGLGTAIATKAAGTTPIKTISAQLLKRLPSQVGGIVGKLAPAEKAIMLQFFDNAFNSIAPEQSQ